MNRNIQILYVLICKNDRNATITSKSQFALPKDIRKKQGFKEGSKLAVIAFDDHIELRPFEEISETMYSMFASEKSLAKDWLSKEDEEE